eukprot:3162700-Pyramimonas_sp.AAC.1
MITGWLHPGGVLCPGCTEVGVGCGGVPAFGVAVPPTWDGDGTPLVAPWPVGVDGSAPSGLPLGGPPAAPAVNPTAA